MVTAEAEHPPRTPLAVLEAAEIAELELLRKDAAEMTQLRAAHAQALKDAQKQQAELNGGKPVTPASERGSKPEGDTTPLKGPAKGLRGRWRRKKEEATGEAFADLAQLLAEMLGEMLVEMLVEPVHLTNNLGLRGGTALLAEPMGNLCCWGRWLQQKQECGAHFQRTKPGLSGVAEEIHLRSLLGKSKG